MNNIEMSTVIEAIKIVSNLEIADVNIFVISNYITKSFHSNPNNFFRRSYLINFPSESWLLYGLLLGIEYSKLKRNE